MQAEVTARETFENGAMFISLPTSDTWQAVCSWPSVPVSPAEVESEQMRQVLAR